MPAPDDPGSPRFTAARCYTGRHFIATTGLPAGAGAMNP